MDKSHFVTGVMAGMIFLFIGLPLLLILLDLWVTWIDFVLNWWWASNGTTP